MGVSIINSNLKNNSTEILFYFHSLKSEFPKVKECLEESNFITKTNFAECYQRFESNDLKQKCIEICLEFDNLIELCSNLSNQIIELQTLESLKSIWISKKPMKTNKNEENDFDNPLDYLSNQDSDEEDYISEEES